MNSKMSRALIVLLFAVTFMFIGWISPVILATYAPNEHVIKVHEFSAENTTIDAGQHNICFDRTVHYPAAGRTFTELYLIENRDNSIERTEIAFKTYDRYYQKGRTEVVTPLGLPDNLKPGKYRYLLVIKMELADGRVERAFTYESQPFYVKRQAAMNSSDEEFSC